MALHFAASAQGQRQECVGQHKAYTLLSSLSCKNCPSLSQVMAPYGFRSPLIFPEPQLSELIEIRQVTDVTCSIIHAVTLQPACGSSRQTTRLQRPIVTFLAPQYIHRSDRVLPTISDPAYYDFYSGIPVCWALALTSAELLLPACCSHFHLHPLLT